VKPAGPRIAAPILSFVKTRLEFPAWRFRGLPWAAIVVIGLITGGCAAKKKEPEDAWLKDKNEVMHVLEQTQRNQIQQYMLLENKLLELEKLIEQSEEKLARLETSIQELDANLKKLETTVRLTSNEDIERNLENKIEKIKAALNKIRQHPAPPPKPRVTPAKSSGEVKKDTYIVAYLALKSGDYKNATTLFEKFLSAYPNDEYADQGYYWLGVSYYSLHNLPKAAAAFSKVVEDYPEGSKHEAALLKLAQIYQDEGQTDKVRFYLERLLAEHPGSPEARIARERLDALETPDTKAN